ncbi:MAG: type II secretion system protein GspK [Myxococcota bacterium]|nr:type II secretion system protein GspK [Myxococcota bacterium]
MSAPIESTGIGPFAGSGDSRARERRARRARGIGVRAGEHTPSLRERGIALVIAMTAIAILAVMLADMHESTTSAYVVATTERDQLRAEYMAKSGLNLTRLLVAQEPAIRTVVAPLYSMLIHRPPPMIPVWQYADAILRPFCNYDSMEEMGLQNTVGVDFATSEGLGDTGGSCEIIAVAENSKLNVSDPLSFDGDRARTGVAMQMFGLMGGYQSPSPFDPLFEGRDADGQFTSRLDVVSALIDWWDYDTDRTTFDPGASTVASGGAEDDVYRMFDDPYQSRNAPFDSIEEMRMVRGVSDDFWATFVEPDPDDPRTRSITIYGSGAVNPNEAQPEVLIARVCSILVDQPLCTDPIEASKFIQVLRTLRMIAPIPFFTRGADFINFLEGRGGPQDLYPMLQAFPGAEALLFSPVTIRPEQRTLLDATLVTAARILTVQSTGHVGRATVRLRTVLNFHDRWTPPPPNAGTMPGLGIYYYYRVD